VKVCVLDTGPIVAHLDAGDAAHEWVEGMFREFRGQFVTSGAVIAEAMYFALGVHQGPEILVEFLELSGTRVIECCQPADLRSAVRLMKKYADTPMDFADATLVLLADSLRHYEICTLDKRGFSVFRTPAGKRFRMISPE
jgi:uncharacterized protein